jgi:hypothetical protein
MVKARLSGINIRMNQKIYLGHEQREGYRHSENEAHQPGGVSLSFRVIYYEFCVSVTWNC